MIDFEITILDIIKFNKSFDSSMRTFYENEVKDELKYVKHCVSCYLKDPESFAMAALKNKCIINNWEKIINDYKDLKSIKNLYGIYCKEHNNTIEGLSYDIINKFKYLFNGATK